MIECLNGNDGFCLSHDEVILILDAVLCSCEGRLQSDGIRLLTKELDIVIGQQYPSLRNFLRRQKAALDKFHDHPEVWGGHEVSEEV